MSEVVAGVDIGGTGIRAGTMQNGRISRPVLKENLSNRTVDEVVFQVTEMVQRLGDVDAVGIAVPGFVQQGVVLDSPNFPGWKDVALQERLELDIKRPVRILNDANAATLGAWRTRGAFEDLVVLTLGTGVGGGVMTNGTLLEGKGGVGGELGHVFVGGDWPCGCGSVGCLEAWCSTVGLVAAARRCGHEIHDGRDLIRLAQDDCSWAKEILQDAGRALGRGIAGFMHVFGPNVVLLIGGLTEAREWLVSGVETALSTHAVAPLTSGCRVEWGERADMLAIVGACEYSRDALLQDANPYLSG